MRSFPRLNRPFQRADPRFPKTFQQGCVFMKIAVITGASSGLGKEFAFAVVAERADVEEIWLIARREDRLSELANSISKKTRVLPLDLSDEECLRRYRSFLETEKPEIGLLINNAGFGKLGDFDCVPAEESAAMIRLNCESLTVMTALSLPYMKEGGEIINTCSIASFAPNTRMAVYSSTKAYVMSFSRALRKELQPRRINVLAACPGPMDTEFLPVAGIEPGAGTAFDTLPKVDPAVMAKKSLAASAAKKSVYTNRAMYKLYRVFAKILPHGFIMKMSGV